MKKESLVGSVDDALRLQQQNQVPEQLCGPWYHGTGNRSLSRLTNKGPSVTWLTRSPAGGISWGPRVLIVYVVSPLFGVSLTDAGAGDNGGCDPDNPAMKLPGWWLKVPSAEIESLMVIGACDKEKLDDRSLQNTLTDEFYLDLRSRLCAIRREEPQ